jgi:mxaJ protein
VRRDEGALRQEIEAALQRSKPEVDAVLAQYHVPRLDPGDPQ